MLIKATPYVKIDEVVKELLIPLIFGELRSSRHRQSPKPPDSLGGKSQIARVPGKQSVRWNQEVRIL
jgi:hypothetical protein